MNMRSAARSALLVILAGIAGACGTDAYVGDTLAGGKDAAVQLPKADAAVPTPDVGGSADAGDDSDALIGVYQVSIAPARQLDLVFMIDNSPSMAPKQQKLITQFPRLIEALKDPKDGSLPDLRIAIIDSDLGTGGAYPAGSCGPKTLSDGTVSNYGDLGRFQMINATACGVTSANSLFLEYKAGAPVNFVGDMSAVFACLAGNLGTLGCGEEHSLQAFEFALAAKGIGNEAQQAAFLRPSAYLGLIFLTDEDDCSAATNDGMFGAKPGDTDLSGESASLRCYTRSYQCNGVALSKSGPGYPTTQAFSAPLTQCSARTDACPNPTDGVSSTGTDTSMPTSCSPLKDIKQLANHLKSVKSIPEQIFVAGIFGWPLSDSDLANAVYRIDSVPNPTADPNHPAVFDSWPICYDSNHQPATSAFDVVAAGWGATAGLRNSAFVDEFADSGLKFSICQNDFSSPVTKIGDSFAKKPYVPLCIADTLADVDASTPGLQPDCRVVVSTPTVDPSDSSKLIFQDSPALPMCPSGSSNGAVANTCWQLTLDKSVCPGSGQLVELLRSASDLASGPLPGGTRVRTQCRICPTCDPATY
jgi:hypothetical protein